VQAVKVLEPTHLLLGVGEHSSLDSSPRDLPQLTASMP
jgi:hypothetical protein